MDMKNQNTLRNVPAMWYGNPSAVCYIGAVMRLMEYIGDPVEQVFPGDTPPAAMKSA